MAIHIALKYLVLYLLLLYRWNPAETVGSDESYAPSIASRFDISRPGAKVNNNSSEEVKYNVQTIEEAREGSVHLGPIYRKPQNVDYTETDVDPPTHLPKHLKHTPNEYRLAPKQFVINPSPELKLIDLDVNYKFTTNEVTYEYDPYQDIHTFTTNYNCALKRVRKGTHVVWEYVTGEYGSHVKITNENGESVCRVFFDKPQQVVTSPPEARAYVYSQGQEDMSSSGISVPSDGPEEYRKEHLVILDIKNKFSKDPVIYKRDSTKGIEIFTIKEPYVFSLILKGHRVLWYYNGRGKYPCTALLKPNGKGGQKLKVYFTRDFDFVGIPKSEADRHARLQAEKEAEAMKAADPNAPTKPLYPATFLHDVQYTLDKLSDSVNPFVIAQRDLEQDTLIEGRDYVNIDLKSPNSSVGQQVPTGEHYIHSIDIDLTPKKPAQESVAVDGLKVEVSKPSKETPGSGDENIDVVDERAPKVEKLYSDDDYIDIVDARSTSGCGLAGMPGPCGRTFVPVHVGAYDPTAYSGYGPPYGSPCFNMYQSQDPDAYTGAQVIDYSPLGLAMGPDGQPQPIPVPNPSQLLVDPVPIVTAPRPRAPGRKVRVEEAAEVEEVMEDEDDVLIEEVFDTESDKESQEFDVVVVTAPEGAKVTLDNIKEKEKEASEAQTKVTKEPQLPPRVPQLPPRVPQPSSVPTAPEVKPAATLLAEKPLPQSQPAQMPPTKPAQMPPRTIQMTPSTPTHTPQPASTHILPPTSHIPSPKPKPSAPSTSMPIRLQPTYSDSDIFSPMYEPIYSRSSRAPHLPSATLDNANDQLASLMQRINQVSQAISEAESDSDSEYETPSHRSRRRYVKMPTPALNSKPRQGVAQSTASTPGTGQQSSQAAEGENLTHEYTYNYGLTFEDDDLFTEWYSPLLARVSYPKVVEIAPPVETFAGVPIGYDADIFDTMYNPIYSSPSFWSSTPKAGSGSSDSDIFDVGYEPVLGGSSNATYYIPDDIFDSFYQPVIGGSSEARFYTPNDIFDVGFDMIYDSSARKSYYQQEDDIFSTVYDPFVSSRRSLVPQKPQAQPKPTDADDMFSDWYTPTYSAHSAHSQPTSPGMNQSNPAMNAAPASQSPNPVAPPSTPFSRSAAPSAQVIPSLKQASTPPRRGLSMGGSTGGAPITATPPASAYPQTAAGTGYPASSATPVARAGSTLPANQAPPAGTSTSTHLRGQQASTTPTSGDQDIVLIED